MAGKNVYRFVTGTDLTATLTENRSFELPVIQSGLSGFAPHMRKIPAQFRIETSHTPGDMFRINGMGQTSSPPPVVH